MAEKAKVLYYPTPKSKCISRIYRCDVSTELELPLYLSRTQAGFPSPGDDFIEMPVDLNKLYIKHPEATFYARVSGNSMIDIGIFPGDMLIVDRAAEAKDGNVIVAALDGELVLKRLKLTGGKVFLVPENQNFETIEVKEGMSFEVWGVVINSIREFL